MGEALFEQVGTQSLSLALKITEYAFTLQTEVDKLSLPLYHCLRSTKAVARMPAKLIRHLSALSTKSEIFDCFLASFFATSVIATISV